MTPRQEIYDAIKNARLGISTWLTMPLEKVEYRFALVPFQLLDVGLRVPELSLLYRRKVYVPLDPKDWTIGYSWCLAKVSGRVRLKELCVTFDNDLYIDGHRRQPNDLLAIVRGGRKGLYRRDLRRCIGTNKPMTHSVYGGGTTCPDCKMFFQHMSLGQMTPAHFPIYN